MGKRAGVASFGHVNSRSGDSERSEPLFVFDQLGDIERALLRKGNVYNGSIKSVEIALYIIVFGDQYKEPKQCLDS